MKKPIAISVIVLAALALSSCSRSLRTERLALEEEFRSELKIGESREVITQVFKEKKLSCYPLGPSRLIGFKKPEKPLLTQNKQFEVQIQFDAKDRLAAFQVHEVDADF